MVGTKLSQQATRLLFAATLLLAGPSVVAAQEPTTLQVSISNHRFQPAEIVAPANTAIRLRIKNLDATPAEFESVSLRVEKIIAAKSEGVVNLRPLQPGRYKFFDDFHRDTAQGTLVVQ
ncbi:MAG: cupredoxin domain-containing protein [Proteobacteria bacterium]|nr:cupredoxin domain-containing protein [Pseudomonadota bacterium]